MISIASWLRSTSSRTTVAEDREREAQPSRGRLRLCRVGATMMRERDIWSLEVGEIVWGVWGMIFAVGAARHASTRCYCARVPRGVFALGIRDGESGLSGEGCGCG